MIEYNNIGENSYDDWQDKLTAVIKACPKFERLNISNNKIGSEAFKRMVGGLTISRSLKLI